MLCLASTADIGTDPGTNSIIPVVKPVARTRYDFTHRSNGKVKHHRDNKARERKSEGGG